MAGELKTRLHDGHRDALGSVRVETSGATVVAGRDYDPWGVELAGRTLGAAAAGGGPGFTGHPRDPASGLDETWARSYAAGLGRWTAPDPLKADFPGWSPYNYVENDPLGKVDPDGLCPKKAANGDICLDFFSRAQTALLWKGDHREYDANAALSESRAQIVASVNGVSFAESSPSCRASSNSCTPSSLDVTFTRLENGGFTLTVRATNNDRVWGILPNPPIDASVTFSPSRGGGFSILGDRDYMPALGIFRRVDGVWEELDRRPEKGGHRLIFLFPNDKWRKDYDP